MNHCETKFVFFFLFLSLIMIAETTARGDGSQKWFKM